MSFKFDKSKVSYEITVDYEDTEVRGNAIASNNDAFDRSIEDKILERIDSGDVWAWAAVTVTAHYEGIDFVQGTDYLGCCSYESEEDFEQPGGYYDDMKDEACADLRYKLAEIYDKIT